MFLVKAVLEAVALCIFFIINLQLFPVVRASNNDKSPNLEDVSPTQISHVENCNDPVISVNESDYELGSVETSKFVYILFLILKMAVKL